MNRSKLDAVLGPDTIGAFIGARLGGGDDRSRQLGRIAR